MTQDAVWQEEQQRLAIVLEKIRVLIEQSEALSAQRQSTVAEARKDFWDDISVNLSNRDEIMETYTSITQQNMMLAGQERSLQHAEDTRYRLLRMYNSPYFGRIDFTEEGTSDTVRVYIGISSVLDEAAQTYWVYDWRAPISNLFYDYPPGPATYATPMGEISGTLDLKRQFMIRGGELKAVFDTGLAIGDEVLQKMLGQSADDHMKSIVATIQKEQNQIIRDDRHQVLIVQGAAGSGKTSVALQRVAYLLYKHRNTLNSDNMVLFSPNALFNSYISTVLPELGEANMQQTTYQEYLQLRLGRQFHVEDAYDQLEYTLTAAQDADYEVRLEGIRYKSSRAFIEVMERYAAMLERSGMIFSDLVFHGKPLINAQQMLEQFYRLDPGLKLSNKVQLLKEWLLKELKRLAKEMRQEAWVKAEIELLGKEDYQRAFHALEKQRSSREIAFDDAEQEAQLLGKFVVHEWFKPLREKIKRLGFVSAAALYKQLLTDEAWFKPALEGLDVPDRWDLIRCQTLKRMEQGGLQYEDATPLLYLSGLIEGFHSYNGVRHVIVDEAQDYSAFQLAFLKRLFPRAKMTLLGDFNQAIFAQSAGRMGKAAADYEVVYDLYGRDRVELIRLARSYRSTYEIVEFTKFILPDREEVEPFNRHGQAPSLVDVQERSKLAEAVVKEVRNLQADGIRSIAILCKTAEETEELWRWLGSESMLDANLVTKETRMFQSGIQCMPAYLAKGLEFDAVILYDASAEQYAQESERKLLYTACTRAMHRLTILFYGAPSPFLSMSI